MNRSVRIGPIDYRVEIVGDLHDSAGELDGRIEYRPSLISLHAALDPQARLITLWHEVLHGILTNSGETKHNERLLAILSHGVVQVLKDNPELAEAE